MLSIPGVLLRFDIYFSTFALSILPWFCKNILTWLNLDYTEIAERPSAAPCTGKISILVHSAVVTGLQSGAGIKQ